MNRASRGAMALRTILASALAGCLVAVPWSAEGLSGHQQHRAADENERPSYERRGLPRVIAHRGASHAAPENTRPSFRRAIRSGVKRIEMDVQRTDDGRLVLFHDRSLRRTTNVEKVYPKLKTPTVGELSYKKLRRLDAGGWKARKWRDTRIPTLGSILRLGRKHDVRMLVELKDPDRFPGIVRQTLRLLRKRHLMRGGHHDRVQLQSFDVRAMRHAASRSKKVDIGLLYSSPPAALDRLRWAQSINSNHAKLTRHWVHRAQRRGIRVVAWGVNSPRSAMRALRLDVNGISTNRPGRTRRLVRG